MAATWLLGDLEEKSRTVGRTRSIGVSPQLLVDPGCIKPCGRASANQECEDVRVP